MHRKWFYYLICLIFSPRILVPFFKLDRYLLLFILSFCAFILGYQASKKIYFLNFQPHIVSKMSALFLMKIRRNFLKLEALFLLYFRNLVLETTFLNFK